MLPFVEQNQFGILFRPLHDGVGVTFIRTVMSSVGYPFDSGSHKMLWSRESIYQEANPEVTALARRGAA